MSEGNPTLELTHAEANLLADLVDRVLTGMEKRGCEDEREYPILEDIFSKLREEHDAERGA